MEEKEEKKLMIGDYELTKQDMDKLTSFFLLLHQIDKGIKEKEKKQKIQEQSK